LGEKEIIMKDQSIERLRALRTIFAAATIFSGLTYLAVSAMTMIGPIWFIAVVNVVPFALMLIFGFITIKIIWRIKTIKKR